VDPTRYQGTIYQAANWRLLGLTKGYVRTRAGYSDTPRNTPKKVFVLPLHLALRAPCCLTPGVPDWLSHRRARMQVTAEHMRSLPDCFKEVPAPRRAEGRRHRLEVVLAIAAAATLCGMHGYKAMADWAQALGMKARARFRCRLRNRQYLVPSERIIRNVLILVDPHELDLK